MASRRDELNAYTFAKKRMVAAFLQPSPTGTEESAPRPLRAVLPGVIIGVLILVGFGVWGMFKPKEPEGWDEKGKKVIVGSESTTRYVVLDTDGKDQLHPVLNLASAKLLLDPGEGEVVKVEEKVLDSGKLPQGATVGIPYAPDRLPSADEASADMRWAVCERPSKNSQDVRRAAFILADREKEKVEGKDRLRGGELMYVQSGDRHYLLDKKGKKYRIGDDEKLLRAVVGDRQRPQQVSSEWLKTFPEGDPIRFPTLPSDVNEPAGAPGGLPDGENRVGTVLRAPVGSGHAYYLVLKGRVVPVSDFMAKLLLGHPKLADQDGKAEAIGSGALETEGSAFGGDRDWPQDRGRTVNESAGEGKTRDTLCNVLRDVDSKTGSTTLSTWASDSYPAQLPTGATSAYVTPGAGQLFRQVTGEQVKTGPVFLITDTGLRYTIQSNRDGSKEESGIGSDKKDTSQRQESREAEQEAKKRLGYEKVDEQPVPATWSRFLPTGPRLSTADASQPQGS